MHPLHFPQYQLRLLVLQQQLLHPLQSLPLQLRVQSPYHFKILANIHNFQVFKLSRNAKCGKPLISQFPGFAVAFSRHFYNPWNVGAMANPWMAGMMPGMIFGMMPGMVPGMSPGSPASMMTPHSVTPMGWGPWSAWTPPQTMVTPPATSVGASSGTSSVSTVLNNAMADFAGAYPQ